MDIAAMTTYMSCAGRGIEDGTALHLIASEVFLNSPPESMIELALCKVILVLHSLSSARNSVLHIPYVELL